MPAKGPSPCAVFTMAINAPTNAASVGAARSPQHRDNGHDTMGTYVSARPARPPNCEPGAASKRMKTDTRNNAQATAPAANTGMVMPPERRIRNRAHVTTTGGNEQRADEIRQRPDPNVAPGTGPPVATCQAVASPAPMSASGIAPTTIKATSSRALSEMERKWPDARHQECRAGGRDNLDSAVAQRVEGAWFRGRAQSPLPR